MRTLDLNCDMGELKPGSTANCDAALMPFISSCNVACGFHSGYPAVMEQTIRAALAQGVKVGAHPSYNDREHFGRRSIQVDRGRLMAEIRYQIGAVKGMVESMGGKLHHVKAHGALYNDMGSDIDLARDYVSLVKEFDPALKVYALAGSQVVDICRSVGMVAVNEAFVDRRYESRAKLMSRAVEGAVLHGWMEIQSQVDDLLRGGVRLANGEYAEIPVDTLCLHSDTPDAVKLGKKIHEHLKGKDVQITADR